MKTLIFHESFTKRSGSERMSIDMANILSADIATSIWSIKSYDPNELGYHGRIYELFPKYHGGWVGYIRMKWRFLFSQKVTKNYDTIIMSDEASTVVHSLSALTKKVYYAHTLPHELFDKKREYMKRVLFFYHEFYSIALFVRKYLFLYEMRKMDIVMTNSEHNKKWLEEWTGRKDIIVLPPPVNMLRFRPLREKIPYVIEEHNNVESVIEREIHHYYISTARLTEAKRVDRIVHAFSHMPEKNLIVLYNPDDPAKEQVMRYAVGCSNIFFHHETKDMKMAGLIASAVASIALGKEESFGSIAVESMACGIPVISVNNGWFAETVIHGKTGILMPDDFTIYDTMEAVKWMTPERALAMRGDCVARAGEYSVEVFGKKIKELLAGQKK